ncbi:MAG: CvpA family protein [Gammaproteobacteria bacterium]|nr:CvpA family protein [Gammaproteobacteria bacterium]
MTFNWLDYAIISLILISSLVSLLRGFVREALSLAFWVVAFFVAQMFFRDLAVPLAQWISVPSLQLAAAFALIFIAVLFAGGLFTFLIAKLIDATGLSGTDRVIGMLFGATRGALIVAGLVLLAGLTPMPQDPWWQQSLLVGHFEELASWLRGLLPADFAERIRLGSEQLISTGVQAMGQPPQPIQPTQPSQP